MNQTRPSRTRPPEVVIGLPTYRRAAGLMRCLPELVRQAERLVGARARVVVVDNSPDADARALVETFAGGTVQYLHEPRPGIAAARNRALDAARGADALVCCDDDELPRSGWLQALVDSWQSWGCAAVTGPVETVFVQEPDAWVRSSGMFATTVRETGSAVPGADSGNLLLDVAAIGRLGLRFDERFGLSGGSDTMLAHSIRARGGEVRWCQEALMTEIVPIERTSHRWVVNRTVRTSNTWSRMRLALAPRPADRLRTRIELSARGGYRCIRGAANLCRGRLVSAVDDEARGAVDLASGRGLLLGAVGRVRYEYSRG